MNRTIQLQSKVAKQSHFLPFLTVNKNFCRCQRPYLCSISCRGNIPLAIEKTRIKKYQTHDPTDTFFEPALFIGPWDTMG